MRKIPIFVLLIVAIGVLLLLNRNIGEGEFSDPSATLEQMISLENLIVKVKAADISSDRYKKLITVLDQISYTQNMSVYQFEDTTKIRDKLKGKKRYRLFIFNNDMPLMKVRFVRDAQLNITITRAHLPVG